MDVNRDFFEYDFEITEFVVACKVAAGCGESIHHNRPSHGLAFNTEGEKKYVFDNRNVLTVKKNDIIFLPENSDYIVNDVVPGDCYAINFKIGEKIKFEPFVFHANNYDKFADIFVKAEKLFREMKKGYIIACKSYLYSLIYAMICENAAEYLPKSKKKLIFPAIDYIHTYYDTRDMEVDFLANLCNMKHSYFRRLFLQCYGISPIKYINDLKLKRAQNLLLQSDYSVETVCKMSGFNNVCYFFRYFKKEVGITPAQYRNEFAR